MTQKISVYDAAQLLASGEAVLIDVREPDEYGAEHIAYAASLPLRSLDDLMKHMSIPADRKIIFQCLKGARGEQACVRIKDCNSCSSPLYNLNGGISAWKEAGLPVITRSTGLTIIRQVQMIVGSLIALMVIWGFMGLTLGFAIAGLLGGALFMAGFTGWCGLALLLSKMPWNK
jgi:rhodanese-related sulfurtransferase